MWFGKQLITKNVVWEAANHKKYGLGSSFSPRMLFGK
jgi:hypothetical protein